MPQRYRLFHSLAAILLLATGTACAADGCQPASDYTPSRNLSRFFAKINAGQPVFAPKIHEEGKPARPGLTTSVRA